MPRPGARRGGVRPPAGHIRPPGGEARPGRQAFISFGEERGLPSMASPSGARHGSWTLPRAISELLGAAAKTYDYDADGNTIRRGSQYLAYDAQNRLHCVGSGPDPCGADLQHFYMTTIDGSRFYHAENGVGVVFYLDDLFEWNGLTNTATAHVYAFGRRIASRVSDNASLRSAWIPAAWPLPVDPEPFGWGLVLLGLGAGAFGLARLGVYGAVAARPVASALSIAVAATLVAPNAWAGGPPSFGDGSSTWVRRWISHDRLGNAIAFTDAAGATIQRRVFEPFGQVAAQSPPTEASATLFTGQQFDASAGLYDFKARWYDAETGRFLSVDPVVGNPADPQAFNAYGYVGNDPMNSTDPTGMCFEFISCAGLVLFIVFTAVEAGAVAAAATAGGGGTGGPANLTQARTPNASGPPSADPAPSTAGRIARAAAAGASLAQTGKGQPGTRESQGDKTQIAQVEREFPPLREMEERFDDFFGRGTLQGRLQEAERQREADLGFLALIDRVLGGAKALTAAQAATQVILRTITRPRTVHSILRSEDQINYLRGELGLEPVEFPPIPEAPDVILFPVPRPRP